MSQSPRLDLGDGSGTGVLNGIVNFLQQGGDVTRLLTAFIVGLPASVFVALGDIIAAVGTFFSTPFEEGGNAIGQIIWALFTAPASLLETGSQVSEDALRQYFGGSLAGLLGIVIAFGLTLIVLYMITLYLQEAETGDALPGLPFDVPTDTLGVEEEMNAEE